MLNVIFAKEFSEANSAVSKRRKRMATVDFIKARLLKGNRRWKSK